MASPLAYGLMGAAQGFMKGLYGEWKDSQDEAKTSRLEQAKLQEELAIKKMEIDYQSAANVAETNAKFGNDQALATQNNQAKADLQTQKIQADADQDAADRASKEQIAAGNNAATLRAAAMRAGQGSGGDNQLVPTSDGYALVNKSTGVSTPVRGADGTTVLPPASKGGASRLDAQHAVMRKDAINFAAAATGRTPKEIEQLSPEQVRDLVANHSRTFTGPILGRVPFTGYDLQAYTNAAAGQQARINNPVGQVSDADFQIAQKSVFSQDKPANVNAQLIYQTLTQGQAPAAPNGASPVAQPAPNAIYQEMLRRGLIK